MAALLESRVRPASTADYAAPSRARSVALGLAVIGLLLAVITFFANLSASTAADPGETLAWSWGLTTTAFATIKVGIGVVLVGILWKLWARVDGLKESLPRLKAQGDGQIRTGEIDTPFGAAVASATEPDELPIHKMAKRMWQPMLVMGAMAVIVGFFISLAWSSDPTSVAAKAWTQGLQFLGEGLLLSGISFLLGTILWALRTGGGEVQSSAGVTIKTLKMPAAAKAFVGLMMLGLMVMVVQFVLYLVVAGGGVDAALWFSWLGPLREIGLGLILSGIALALVAIGNVLGFQFHRIAEIVRTGN